MLSNLMQENYTIKRRQKGNLQVTDSATRDDLGDDNDDDDDDDDDYTNSRDEGRAEEHKLGAQIEKKVHRDYPRQFQRSYATERQHEQIVELETRREIGRCDRNLINGM
ncbi:hypothetical protein KC19_3G069300 [Ceratodon purpureus]|uniref:Uncharacterized protein n=1 Tax=Ceratodon purpureus TaxID=3225 RepID=A0A8T0IJ32_CERPU|nr:hypothetical protein KC19_3G069300 [Ceratodon purpureus]